MIGTWVPEQQGTRGRVSLIEELAKMTWTRCRSKTERATGATWESITSEYRQAWIDGATKDLEAARVALVWRNND